MYLPTSRSPGSPKDLVHPVMLVMVYDWFPKKLGPNSGSSFIPTCIFTITLLVEVTRTPLQPKEAANTPDLYDLAPADFSNPISSIWFPSPPSPSPKRQPHLLKSPSPLMPLGFVVLALARTTLPAASSA